MDGRFGGPKPERTSIRGRKEIVQILDYLCRHQINQSSAREIAEYEIKKTALRTPLRSRANYLRRIVHQYLIPKRIVEIDGKKIAYNRLAELYRLTPFGILYSIHLLPKTHEIVNNLSKNYKKEFPLIFGKFDLFEKKLGKNFIEIIGLMWIAKAGDILSGLATVDPPDILLDFIRDDNAGWNGQGLFRESWHDQISCIIYTNILRHYYSKSLNLEYTTWHRTTPRDKLLKQFWTEFLEEEPEIQKWYFELLKKAKTGYENRNEKIKEIYSLLA